MASLTSASLHVKGDGTTLCELVCGEHRGQWPAHVGCLILTVVNTIVTIITIINNVKMASK